MSSNTCVYLGAFNFWVGTKYDKYYTGTDTLIIGFSPCDESCLATRDPATATVLSHENDFIHDSLDTYNTAYAVFIKELDDLMAFQIPL